MVAAVLVELERHDRHPGAGKEALSYATQLLSTNQPIRAPRSPARAVLRKNFPEVKDRDTTHRTSVLRLRSFSVQQPDRCSDARVLAVPRQRHQPGLACGVRLGSEREGFAGLLNDQLPKQLALVLGRAQGEDSACARGFKDSLGGFTRVSLGNTWQDQ